MSDESKARRGRRLPVGAEVEPDGGVHFRVWAPRSRTVHVVTEDNEIHGVRLRARLEPEEGGYFSGLVETARAGTRYRYQLDDADAYPDPASRFQRDPVLRLQRPRGVDGSVLGAGAFVLRFFGSAGDDRLLIVNLDRDMTYQPAPEPLLAPPAERRWSVLWSSEDTRYGGTGRTEPEVEGRWRITGHAAVLLHPVRIDASDQPERTISAPTSRVSS